MNQETRIQETDFLPIPQQNILLCQQAMQTALNSFNSQDPSIYIPALRNVLATVEKALLAREKSLIAREIERQREEERKRKEEERREKEVIRFKRWLNKMEKERKKLKVAVIDTSIL